MGLTQRNNQTRIREGAVGTILRLSPVGPMPHKDLIIPPMLAGLAEWTDSGLSISLPLEPWRRGPPRL
ncbi:hypothetical protein NQZ68_001588 [Dissostichus eleginoides]|nr:hypothetical protein NQZ68_001588 [Dissostichus eleginoides]